MVGFHGDSVECHLCLLTDKSAQRRLQQLSNVINQSTYRTTSRSVLEDTHEHADIIRDAVTSKAHSDPSDHHVQAATSY